MSTDATWLALADADPQAARAQMADRFRTIVKLPEAAQDEQYSAMITSEYELTGAPLLDFTTRRLRAWIDLGPEEAKTASAGYTRAFKHLPGDMAMRHVLAEQTAVRDMAPEEIATLRQIIPSMVDALPPTRKMTGDPGSAAANARASAAGKRPFWKFWEKN